ncbi:hypothetical protein E4T47_08399 [Aureobasidium subglaciale]|nr:hypothetical protein E4T43_05695 [Aureobasidium subglaciale]KAI5265948.1 hypothetical protein E4T47_08399 [Aureobasidium subglaciale]
MYMPSSRWTWSFLMIAICQAAIGLGLEGYVFAKFQISLAPQARKTTQSRTIPTYLALFIFGFIYQLALVWDALRLKNTIQVIGLCLYNLGLLVYAAVQYDQIDRAVDVLNQNQEIEHGFGHDVKPFLVAVPCVLALGTVAFSFVAWKLYDEFAWTIYKHISADLRLKRRYLVYQIYIALLKFDFFFFLGFTVQFVVVVREHTSNIEFALTIAAIPVTIAILLAAAWFTRRESTLGMCSTIVLYFAAMAYFLFKLVRMYDSSNPERVADYEPARKSLTTFAVITLLLLILTIVNCAWCTANFNKGLKPHIQRRRVIGVEDKGYSYERRQGSLGGAHAMGAVPARMTID